MVNLEPFGVEQYMDKYETGITYNLGETCVDSLTVKELFAMYGDNDLVEKMFLEQLANLKLTYGHIRGSETLRNLIASLYTDEEVAAIGSGDIVVTNGAIGANFLLFFTLISPGDSVIAVDPCYQQLSSVPNVLSGGNLVKFELKSEHQYQPDVGELEALFERHKPKLFVANNPHNPTGTLWDNATLEKVVDLCRRYGTYVLCDEVYRPLYHSVVDAPKSIVNFGYDRAISTGSMSKALSLAGLRLGWIVSKDKRLVEDLFSKRDYNTISVSRLDEQLAITALGCTKQILKRNYAICTSNLELLERYVVESGGALEWTRPVAGTTAFVKINGADTMELCRDLAENFSTLIVPGEVFDRPGYCRIGFGNSPQDLEGGLETLKRSLIARNLWKP